MSAGRTGVTARQWTFLMAVMEHRSVAAAALSLGVHKNIVYRGLRAMFNAAGHPGKDALAALRGEPDRG